MVLLKAHLLPCAEAYALPKVRATCGIGQGDCIVHRLCRTGTEVGPHETRSIADENRSIKEELRSLVVQDCLREGFSRTIDYGGEILRE